jgi:hypothetical protein
MEEIVSVAFPEFVTTTLWGKLIVPTARLPKLMLDVERVAAGAPSLAAAEEHMKKDQTKMMTSDKRCRKYLSPKFMSRLENLSLPFMVHLLDGAEAPGRLARNIQNRSGIHLLPSDICFLVLNFFGRNCARVKRQS